MTWLILNVSLLKIKMVMRVNTVNETNSWMTLSCHKLKGPPLPMYPMRLAGTMNEYSANAIPQLKSTTNGNESLLNQGVFCKCR